MSGRRLVLFKAILLNMLSQADFCSHLEDTFFSFLRLLVLLLHKEEDERFHGNAQFFRGVPYLRCLKTTLDFADSTFDRLLHSSSAIRVCFDSRVLFLQRDYDLEFCAISNDINCQF